MPLSSVSIRPVAAVLAGYVRNHAMQEVHCRISGHTCKTQGPNKPHGWRPKAIRSVQGLRPGYKQASDQVPCLRGADGEDSNKP